MLLSEKLHCAIPKIDKLYRLVKKTPVMTNKNDKFLFAPYNLGQSCLALFFRLWVDFLRTLYKVDGVYEKTYKLNQLVN